MGRLIRGAGALLVYFCVATVLTLLVGLAYGFATGALAPDRMQQMLAVLHGTPAAAPTAEKTHQVQTPVTEQPSLDAQQEQRSAAWRDMELRERILGDVLGELKKLQAALEDEKDRFDTYAKAFKATLASERTEAVAKGRQEFQAIVESMKPKQAKEQLLIQYKAGKADVVVEVLKNMEETRRAKIVAEFKAADDSKVLGEILESIRNPEVGLIDDTLKALNQPGPSS
jgi:flagellar motility protein MotE (MotC chaperone)